MQAGWTNLVLSVRASHPSWRPQRRAWWGFLLSALLWATILLSIAVGALVIDAERQALRRAVSRATERDEIREAMTASAATESIGRRLGDELIAASREHRRMASAPQHGALGLAWHRRGADGPPRLRTSND